MATTFETSKFDDARRRRFLLLAVAGAAVVVLGTMLPRLLPSTPEPPRETRKAAAEKALPPMEKAAPVPNGKAVDKDAPNTKTKTPKINTSEPDLPEPPALGAILARLAGGTLVVVVFGAATAYGIGRWMKGRNMLAPKGPLKIVAALPLGGRCSIILFQAGEQNLIAGVDATGLRTVLHLPGALESLDQEDALAPAAVTALQPEQSTTILAARVPVMRSVIDAPARLPN